MEVTTQSKKYSRNGVLNFIFNVCLSGHLAISVVLNILGDFCSWKKEVPEAIAHGAGMLTGGKKCNILQGRYKVTAGIYSRLVTPYFIVLQGSFAAAKQ